MLNRWLAGVAAGLALMVGGAIGQNVPMTAPAVLPPYAVQPAPAQLVAPPSPAGTVFGLWGQELVLLYSQNPNVLGPCSYAGFGDRPVQRDPLVNPGDVTPGVGAVDGVFEGGRVRGNIGLDDLDGYVNQATGGYCNSVAVNHRRTGSTHAGVRQIRIDRVWDAIRWPKEPCNGAGVSCNHTVDHVWVSNVRDDAIEADLPYNGMTVRDSLFDRVFSFISMAPGGTPNDHSTETITLERNLIRLYGWPYSQEQVDGSRVLRPYHIAFFKTGSGYAAKMPRIAIRDTVIAADMYNPNNSTKSTDTGSHWANAFRRIDPARCSGNFFLWMPDSPVPAVMLDQMPAGCFTVLSGADARAYWDVRRAAWIASHPDAAVPAAIADLPGVPKRVERLPGD